MDYTLFRMDNYNLHIIKTDKFKSIKTKIVFKCELKKEELTMRNMISNILFESNSKYKTRREMEMVSEELYGISLGCENIKSGKYGLTVFSETFLNEKYTEKGMNEKSLEFFLDIIFKPDIENNMFNKESFKISKNIVKDEINSIKDNPRSYAKIKLYELMNENNPLSFFSCGNLSDLKKITNKKLYKYYLNLINNSIVDIYVIGDININNTKKIFDKAMKYKTKKIETGSHYIIEHNINNDVKYNEEILPINQSNLYMGFKFDDLSEFELKYVLNIYSFILGGSGDSRLFSSVREENSLCYFISSSYVLTSGILVVNSGCDADQTKKVIELVKEEINKLKKEKITEEELEKAKITFKSGCEALYDNGNSILNTYMSKEYLQNELPVERIKKVNKVTIEDIYNLANKIHLDSIFLLKGDV